MMAGDIDYEVRGKGPTVIFLHGIGGGAESFSKQLEGMPSFRCIAWNMPGYGKSKATVLPPSFASLSEALGTFIRSVTDEPVHLVGQSIGGMVALEHACRQPKQVATLTLIGTTPSFGGRDESFKDAFLKARLAPLEAGKSMPEIAAMAASAIVGPLADDACIAEIEAAMARVSEATWRGILQCLVTFNRRDSLASIQQPCCLIAGTHDENAPARTMEKMADKLPVAEYHLIEGAGHMINQEMSNATNEIIATFIGKNLT